jgi:hypothetical protein
VARGCNFSVHQQFRGERFQWTSDLSVHFSVQVIESCEIESCEIVYVSVCCESVLCEIVCVRVCASELRVL